MDYLQYCIQVKEIWLQVDSCFKPYYKWITFNTLKNKIYFTDFFNFCFKPYYKWITFNTKEQFGED